MKNPLVLVWIDVGVWIPFGVLVGYISTQLSTTFLSHNFFPTNDKTQYRLEKYLKIKKWKDKLPEAGDTFKGGVSKRQLSMKTTEGVQAFIIETRRAELVHIFSPIICFTYFLFNPFWLALLMFFMGVFLNAPFGLIQRYNRARCLKILGKPDYNPS